MSVVTLEDLQGCRIARLSGEIDLKSSPAVRKALLACVAEPVPVIVDLGAVDYIDSSGVAGLVEAYQHTRKSGQGFALAQVSTPALRVLQLARLDRIFPIHPTLDEAITALGTA